MNLVFYLQTVLIFKLDLKVHMHEIFIVCFQNFVSIF